MRVFVQVCVCVCVCGCLSRGPSLPHRDHMAAPTAAQKGQTKTPRKLGGGRGNVSRRAPNLQWLLKQRLLGDDGHRARCTALPR